MAAPDPGGTQGAARHSEARPDEEGTSLARPLPSIIGQSVVMKGDLVVGEDLVIEGTFNGTITGYGQDSVTIRRTAKLCGEISASKVRVDDCINLEDAILSGRISRTKR